MTSTSVGTASGSSFDEKMASCQTQCHQIDEEPNTVCKSVHYDGSQCLFYDVYLDSETELDDASDNYVSIGSCYESARLLHSGGCMCYYYGHCPGKTAFGYSKTEDNAVTSEMPGALTTRRLLGIAAPEPVLPVNWNPVIAPITLKEKSLAIDPLGNAWCPIFGTKRFDANRCRLPTLLPSPSLCAEYCDGCNFCIGVHDTESGKCVCRANGLSRMVTEEAVRDQMGRNVPILSGPVQHYLDAMIRIHIDNTVNTLPMQNMKEPPRARNQKSENEQNNAKTAARRMLSTVNCGTREVVRQNGVTDYEIDLEDCLMSLDDGTRLEITVEATDGAGGPVGSPYTIHSDLMKLVHTLRGGVDKCVLGEDCNRGKCVHHEFSRTSIVHDMTTDWGWKCLLTRFLPLDPLRCR